MGLTEAGRDSGWLGDRVSAQVLGATADRVEMVVLVGPTGNRRDRPAGQMTRQLHRALRATAAAAVFASAAACGSNTPSATPSSAVNIMTASTSTGTTSTTAPTPVTPAPTMTAPSTMTPVAPAPDPNLASVVPARYNLVSRTRVTVTPNLPNDAELVISRGPVIGPGVQLAGQDSTEDVQLLTWDPELRRWNLIFDAHTMTVNPQRSSSDYSSQDLERVLAPDHPVINVTAQAVAVEPGHTVIVVSGTDNQTMDVSLQRTAVISVADGLAHQEFYTVLQAGTLPQVSGPADHQQIHLSGRYTSLADPVSSPVRNFTQTIGWTAGSPSDGHGPIGVLDDDRPGIGLTLARPTGTNETTAVTVVASVRPGSPAARAGIHPGEVLEAITPAIPKAAGQPPSDPAVIDQLAAHHTGDRVTLRLRHGDDVRTLTLTTVKIQDVQAGPGAPIPQGAHLGVTIDPTGQVLGAAIASITPDSPAAHGRLAVGDTITQLGAMPVQDLNTLEAALLDTAGQRVAVKVTAADGTTTTLYVTPTAADPADQKTDAYPI